MRPEKQLIVEDLKKQVGTSPFVIVTEYTPALEAAIALNVRLDVADPERLPPSVSGRPFRCHW